MKSIREFLFLSKECGLFYAIYFIYYKAKLKFYKSVFFIKWRKKKEKWRNRISSALFLYKYNPAYIENRRYIKIDQNCTSSIYLRPYSSDESVFYQVIRDHGYRSVIDIYNQFFEGPARYIIDCGSNIGLAAVYLSKHYPDAFYLAIEPFNDNVESIKLNFQYNGLKNYKIIEGGIWNENGKLFINRAFRDGKEWSISLEKSAINKSEIQSYSILDIINSSEREVDILKIDIEGAERVLFEDTEYAKKFLKRVKCVVIEIHDEFNCRERIYECFIASNFFYFNTNDLTVAINRSHI